MSHSEHRFSPNPKSCHCYRINSSYYSTQCTPVFIETQCLNCFAHAKILSSPSLLIEYILVAPFYPYKQHAFLTEFVLVTASSYDDSPLLKYECWPPDALLQASSTCAYASGQPRIMTQFEGRGQQAFCWQNRKTISEFRASWLFFLMIWSNSQTVQKTRWRKSSGKVRTEVW